MFRLNGERERMLLTASRGTQSRRTGMAVDVWRLVHPLRRNVKLLAMLLAISVILGTVVGRHGIPKAYVAKAILLWEPPAAGRAERTREISTLVDSVKLPANLDLVRERLGFREPLHALAKRIDVTTGDPSMLITISATSTRPEAAAELANTMVDVYLDAQRKVSESRLRETAESLRLSLVQSRKSLEESRDRYDRFRTDHRIGDLSIEVQAAIEEVARLRVAANDARVELESSLAEEAAQRRIRSVAPRALGPVDDSPANAARLAEVESNLANARARHTEEHPRVKLLEAEAAELRSRGAAGTSGTARVAAPTPGAGRLEHTVQTRRAAEQRRKALQDVIRESEERASKLTAVEGEAARLLADMNAQQDHVASLLKQSATAEDDVRSASSYFQIVSRASPPDHPERGFGWIFALGFPVAVVLLAILLLLLREMKSLSARTATEAAFWARAPVLWSSSWPRGTEAECRELGRQLANVIESRPGVVGFTVLRGSKSDGDAASWLAELVADRLNARGENSNMVDLRYRVLQEQFELADALEHRVLGEEIGLLRSDFHAVLTVLPSLDDPASVRAALRWIDALVVIVPSGRASYKRLHSLRHTLGLQEHGLGLVMIGVPADLLQSTARTATAAFAFWPPPRRRRRAAVIPAQLEENSAGPLIALEEVIPPR